MLRNKFSVAAAVLIAGSMILVAKFIAWGATDSNAILSDALESVINVLAGGFALYSLRLSAKPRDKNHPYGHGKVEFLSSGLEGGLILAAGTVIVGKSLLNFFQPHQISNLDFGLWMSVATGLANLLLGYWMLTVGKRDNSIVLQANGKHLLSDAGSTAGLLVGLLLIRLTGILWIDNFVAILFGLLIARTGWKVLRKSVAGIMDEADIELLTRTIKLLENKRENRWIDLHNLRVIRYGELLHVDAHVTLPWYLSLQQAHDEGKKIEDLLSSDLDSRLEAFFHMDPCEPTSCSICTIADCTHRKQDFKKRIPWTIDNVIINEKHTLDKEC